MRRDRQNSVSGLRATADTAVRKTEAETGSRMLAYEKVAAAMDISASYLRKFITVVGTPEPRFSVGMALHAYYQNLCERVDAKVSEQRSDITRLLGEINEADQINMLDAVPSAVARGIGTDRKG